MLSLIIGASGRLSAIKAPFAAGVWPAFRMAAAIALTAGSSLALWQRYEGNCVIPDYDLTAYIALCAVFVVGFVWSAYELALRLSPNVWAVSSRHLFALTAGIGIYVLIGLATWMSNPDTLDGGDFRTLISITWPVGWLLHAGAFSDYSCGY
jgi:hypothetical protein